MEISTTITSRNPTRSVDAIGALRAVVGTLGGMVGAFDRTAAC